MTKQQIKTLEHAIKGAKEEKKAYKKTAPDSKSYAFWQGYLNALENLKHDLNNKYIVLD